VAKQVANLVKSENYDLVIGGRESIDYNGGMVPGMIAALTDYNFVDKCISIEINNGSVTASREIEGGKEIVESKLPIVIAGQKGIVEESDLRIPNMRGIMMARRKELQVVDPIDIDDSTSSVNFEKPQPKAEVTLVSSENVDELINLLHNEAKAI
jgi:electron transfer flavoprotein beta subunit